MQQIKIFKTIESELISMEAEINAWIKDSGKRVISITGNIAPQTGNSSAQSSGNFAPSDVLIIVMYEDVDG